MTRSETIPIRVAAVALLAGTVLYLIPSALHGDPPIDSARATLEYVQQRPSWRPVHLINILAVLMWACAFTGLAPLLAPTARRLGRILGTVFTTATAVFAVYFSIHAFGLTTVADQYVAPAADQGAVAERTETILVLLGSTAFTAQAMMGLSIALAGLVLARSTMLPAWIGWCGVAAGCGWLLGALLVDFAVIVPFTVLTWAWTGLLGTVLLLRTRPVTAPAATP